MSVDSTIRLLRDLRSQGITVWREGDRLRYRAPAQGLPSACREALVERKRELLDFLAQGEVADEPPLVRVPRDGVLPLTAAQSRLWFLDQLQPGLPAYNVFDVIALDHAIDVDALQRAVTEVVRRHEGLRTVFPAVDGVPRLHVLPASDVALPLIDLSALPADERERELRRLVDAEVRAPFDLAAGPLLRVTLVRTAPDRHTWLLSIHHIVSDDWSKKLLNQELETLYTACREGRPSPLPELPVQWADFASWQQRWLSGRVLQGHVDYWKRQLSGELPTLALVADHARRQPPVGRNGRFWFPPAQAASLRRFCDAEDVTLFMLLVAAHAAVLARTTRQDDLVIGSPISDRHHVETEGLIGFLLNTLPLRVRIDARASFRTLLQQVKQTCLDGYSWQAVPYEALMQDLQVERTASGNPLFQTVLALLNTPDAAPGPSALWGTGTEPPYPQFADDESCAYVSDGDNGTTKFDLSITFIEHRLGLWGRTEYDSDVFDEASVAAFVGRLQALLRSAVAEPDGPVGELAWMPRADLARVTGPWSRGPERTLEIGCLHEWVERRALADPDAIALEDDRQRLNYAELDARANRLAHALRARGVRNETPVGLLLERSVDLFVALLAGFKAGAACVPLDVNYPDERLALVARDAAIAILLSTAALSPRLPDGFDRLLLDVDADVIARHPAHALSVAVDPEQIACVLYTSGSTGRPKGVPLPHRSLVNYAQDAACDYALHAGDRMLQFASIAFDASFEECLTAWRVGATLVMRPDRMIDSTTAFVDHARRLGLTAMVLPTAYWHELVATLETHPLPPSLRCVVIGGERALPEKLAEWQRLVGERISVFNTYGPTEGTIAVTRGLFPARAQPGQAPREVSIGRPVGNSRVVLLDDGLQPVPPGVPGELYLGGLALARGYLGKPGLTAERFVPHPFPDTPGERLYRTGDLARFLPDGALQYLGRVDAQVKIRGYRVEPREIELMLQEHADVKDAVVAAREDVPGERSLVAYVVLGPGVVTSMQALRAFLKSRLPAYMLPAAFVSLPVLPLNVNGKVNVRALPRPDADRTGDGALEVVAPRTETERRVAEIWRGVLSIERLGIDENFFDLGGHSLLATRVIARINDALRIDLPLRRLFEAPTIAEFALVVEALVAITVPASDRVVSVRSLQGAADGGAALVESGAGRMLAGLEGLSDEELAAMLGEDDAG